MALLTVEGLCKVERSVQTVNNVSFSLQPFQKMAIAGETGSGKTSLLKMIAGLMQPSQGKIFFNNERVRGPREKLMAGHSAIGYLSQHFELRNNYRVSEELDSKNVLSAEQADEIFTVCRIEHLLGRMTNELSGGEKQRIALARVLIASPQLILLDEPFSNLDIVHKRIMKEVIKEISARLGITCLMVLHDAPDILSWAETIMVMKDGEVIQQGSPSQIYRQPINEYCAGLFGPYNLVRNLSVLSAINNLSVHEKMLMIRPENVLLVSHPENAALGTVTEILYWGSYYSADVMVEEEKIRLHIQKPLFNKGDRVFISMMPEDVWYW